MVVRQRWLFWSALVVLVLSTYLLVTGSAILLWTLIKKPLVPFGTVSTGLGLIALSIIVSYISSQQTYSSPVQWFFKTLSGLCLVLALLWMPMGRLLSGNWSNSFIDRPQASLLFWNYTYASVGLPLLVLVIYALNRLWTRFAKK